MPINPPSDHCIHLNKAGLEWYNKLTPEQQKRIMQGPPKTEQPTTST